MYLSGRKKKKQYIYFKRFCTGDEKENQQDQSGKESGSFENASEALKTRVNIRI